MTSKPQVLYSELMLLEVTVEMGVMKSHRWFVTGRSGSHRLNEFDEQSGHPIWFPQDMGSSRKVSIHYYIKWKSNK